MTKQEHDQFDKDHGVRTDGQAHLGPVNLDCMDEDELLIASRHPVLHEQVRHYALLRAGAMQLRQKGYIKDAERVDEKLDTLYENLPKSCKW